MEIKKGERGKKFKIENKIKKYKRKKLWFDNIKRKGKRRRRARKYIKFLEEVTS